MNSRFRSAGSIKSNSNRGRAVPGLVRFVRESPLVGDACWLVLAMLLASVAAVMVLKPWVGPFNVPIGYSGDALANLVSIQTIIENGWYLHNARVGAPFGLDMSDYAVGADNGNFLLIRFLTQFTSWAPYVLNAFFLIGFPLVAATSFIVLRALRVGRGAALMGAVLFAIVPYHFIRGTAHLFLGSYWAVPLGAYLFVQVFRQEALFRRRGSRSVFNPLSWATGRTAVTLCICVLVASGGVYYAVFTVLFVLVAGAVSLVSSRTVAGPLAAVLVVTVIGCTLLLNTAPSLVYSSVHGKNTQVASRLPIESEIYSLRLAQLLLPQPSHRSQTLARLWPEWAGPVAFNGEGPQSAGSIGTFGLLFLLLLLLVRAARAGGGKRVGRFESDTRLQAFAVGVAVAILYAASGGVAVLVAFFVSPQLRASNRISIFIAFFAIAAVAVLFDSLRPRRGGPLSKKVAYGVAIGGVLAFGFWDQTSPSFSPDYQHIVPAWHGDELYGRMVAAKLNGNGEVLQLPYHPFPESVPVERMADYDQFRSYLHTRKIRWTYGAMKGRPADWQEELSMLPLERQVDAGVLAGADAVEVDRFGYADSGLGVEALIAKKLRGIPVISPDGRLALYDARPYARKLKKRLALRGTVTAAAVRGAALRPLQAEWGAGFTGPEPNGSRWAGPRADLTITNTTAAPRVAIFTAGLSVVSLSGATITAPGAWPPTRALLVGPDVTPLRLALWVPPGGTTLHFTTDAPEKVSPSTDTRPMYLYFTSPQVTDTILTKRWFRRW